MPEIARLLNEEKQRRNMIRAGYIVLSQKPLRHVTLREVIRQADTTPGTFYKFFRDKDAFAAVIVEELTTPFQITVRNRFKTFINSEKFIRRGMSDCVELVAKDAQIAKILSTNQHDFREIFYDKGIYYKIYNEVYDSLEKGIADGAFVVKNKEFLAETIVAEGFDLILLSSRDVEQARKKVDFIVDLIAPYFDVSGETEIMETINPSIIQDNVPLEDKVGES